MQIYLLQIMTLTKFIQEELLELNQVNIIGKKQGSGTAWAIGICVEIMLTQTNNQFWDTTTVTGVAVNGSSGNLYLNGGQSDSWNTGISVNANTIYGFALDVDNRAFYVHVNGTYLTANSNVGDPTSGSSRTGRY